mgnify:FL=1
MAGKTWVAMIHGIGNQGEEFWVDRTKPLKEALKDRGIEAEIAGFRYSMFAKKYASEYWNSIETDLDYRFLRRPALHIFADATVYGHRPEAPQSNYREIHASLHQFLSGLLKGMQDDDRLVVWAHSFGCHIISNFIYDNQRGTGAHNPALQGEPAPLQPLPELDRRLRLLVTTGCNIPLFAAGGPSPVAFARPNDRFRWMNIFDTDDILGWPIRPLGGDFQAIWITDHQENTGGPLRSHTNYWFDFGVNDRIATAIRWL